MSDTTEKLEPERYTGPARWLHWIVAGAIVLQFVLANLADDAESRFREFVLLANHKSVGLTILGLVVLRLAWRFVAPLPPPLPMPHWQRIAANVSHGALYALLLFMPMTGWLMSSASNVPVSWFNLFPVPNLTAADEGLAGLFEATHEAMAKVLIVLAGLHVTAALKHALVDRDGALARISSPLALASFVLVVAIGVFWLVPESRADEAPTAWEIDYEQSFIRFRAEQAGALFEGEWTEWEATIRFDPASPESGKFDVAVTVAGIATGDGDRDDTLKDPEFFDAPTHPEVRYRAEAFRAPGDGRFEAQGTIEVKGKQYAAPLDFTVRVDGARRVLEGEARLDRLALGIGTGEWSDTGWIGQFVDVMVRVEASAP